MKYKNSFQISDISFQLSVISYQLSVVSCRFSVFSYQFFVITAISRVMTASNLPQTSLKPASNRRGCCLQLPPKNKGTSMVPLFFD